MKIESAYVNSFLNLNISGQIMPGELSSTVKTVIDEALSKNVKDANLYINSEGGSVFEAQEVVNELKRLRSVKITVGALAASAATYIMCYFPSAAYSTSQFMIHKPSTYISGNEDEVKSDIKALENITNLYRSAYAKKFSKSEDEIEEMWKHDYWMNSEEALKLGLIDSILDEELQIDDEAISMMVACGCPNIPTKTKIKNMDLKIISQALGKPEDATENDVLSAIQSLKAESKEWKEKYSNLQKAEAGKMVDKAVALGLIPEDLKDVQVKAFEADFDGQSEKLSKLIKEKEEENVQNGVQSAIGAAVNLSKGGKQQTGEGQGTFDYLQKHNAVELARIRTEEPQKYAKLVKDYASGVRYTAK